MSVNRVRILQHGDSTSEKVDDAKPTWRFELVHGIDTARTSADLATLADSIIGHLSSSLTNKVAEQRRRIARLQPDFYTEDDFRVSEDEDLSPPVSREAAPRIFEIIAGLGSPVVKTREVPVSEIKRSVSSSRVLIPYNEAVESMNKFNRQDLGEALFALRDQAIDSGKGRPAAGEPLDMKMFDRAFARQMGGDRSTRLDGLRGIELGR